MEEGRSGRIVVFHPRPEEVASQVALLREAGHRVQVLWPRGAPELAPLRTDPPHAFVIDLGRQPATGRALAVALRQYKDTRGVPIVFVEGEPESAARTRALLPDATYARWRNVRGALREALRQGRRPRGALVVPGTMAAYSGASLPKKLGIRGGTVVALLGAPDGFERTLGSLPERATVRRDGRQPARVVLLFVTSGADLRARLGAAKRALDDPGALWVVWPKKASGIATDLAQTTVRKVGLGAGLVDYKIAAIDATWSGLCFARRRIRR
jgi:CheY-like chemotaxis protein